MQRDRSSPYANSTPGCGPASEIFTSMPRFSLYERSISAMDCRSFSRGTSYSRLGPHDVSTKPAAAAVAHEVNIRRDIFGVLVSVSMGPLPCGCARMLRRPRRRLGRQRFEARLVRIMAVRAQQVALFPAPTAGPAAVHARAPVPQLLSVALTAQPVRFLECHRLAAGQVEGIAIGGVMTVQAPPVLRVVLQYDVGVHRRQFAALAVHRHPRVAVGARVDAFAERRRRNLQTFYTLDRVGCRRGPQYQRGEEQPQPKHSAVPPFSASPAATWSGRAAVSAR